MTAIIALRGSGDATSLVLFSAMSATGWDCLLLQASEAGMCAQAGPVGGSLQINALNVNQTMAQHVHCGPRLHKHTPAFVHVGTNPPDADEAARTR